MDTIDTVIKSMNSLIGPLRNDSTVHVKRKNEVESTLKSVVIRSVISL